MEVVIIVQYRVRNHHDYLPNYYLKWLTDLDIYVSPLQVNVDPTIIWFGLSSLASLVLMQIVFFSL